MAKTILEGNITLNKHVQIKQIKDACYQNGVKIYQVQLVKENEYKTYRVTLEGTKEQLNQLLKQLN